MWFNKEFDLKVDPDGRQDKSSSQCSARPMTAEEREKYGPKSEKKKRGFALTNADIRRSLEHRGIKKSEVTNER